MIGVFVKFFISLAILWLLLMYNVWKQVVSNETINDDIARKSYNKITRFLRKIWYALLRTILRIKNIFLELFQKMFFIIFPKAKKAFEIKDQMTGLNHGPSSYFLKSITPDKSIVITEIKKNRRKSKNV